MKPPIGIVLALSLAGTVLSTGAQAAPPSCGAPDFTQAATPARGAQGMSIQLLGTGGPISDDGRASSGEVIWINGKSRVLIDAGGGTYLRFGQAGARLEDLRFIGISHFHTDHSADLPALLKGAFFVGERSEIELVGPKGSKAFPGMVGFYEAMFGQGKGAFAYLSGLHDGSDGLQIRVRPSEVDSAKASPSLVYQDAEVRVTALGIPHGDVPTLAFRIEGKQGTIVVSADQNGHRPEFVTFAKGADLLVMPAAIDDDADSESSFMHATPRTVGELAAEINPKILVLNHFMGKSLQDKDKNMAEIKTIFHGEVHAGRDLSCYTLDASKETKP
ncbi:MULTISPECIES: MBL fold metallo-hydrolase [Stenotrophomonas]|uniref:MBL fold metallo-hydrolase n=1 Tax=Stenotrophomonas lactitubi TaxID=2045214 RepID=A0AAW4GKM4_9GAMM|nr:MULTISPECIES: MBL fold metallo-hydrolase [Stenotrophomonas]MBM9914539.1 MBL fold metallo-hydrolase [Stenotrophomonas lactitubi]MBM9922840.1 MBL fold metallo-hydrolase [Stenotrophomonas lactitubi]MBM9938668.1 MBL fold metallo-hydrolase [Stenotrophomonas lactitubi]